MLIDVAIHGFRNVINKEHEKILKSKDPIIEIQRMGNMKARVIPVITGANARLMEYLQSKEDPLIQTVRMHQQSHIDG